MMKIILLLSFVLLIFAEDVDFSRVNDWFESSRAAPGAGFSVIHNDEIVHQYVTGVKKLGGDDLTTDTYFPIGSITKTMTTMLLHQLVVDKKCAWNSRIVSILPFWECGDPSRSSMMTLEDLVYHRTGFGAGTGSLPSFTNPKLSLHDYVYSLKYFHPLAEFRAPPLLYNNAGLSIAGLIAEVIEGEDYKHLLQERVLNLLESEPVGYYSLGEMEEHHIDYATGYMRIGPEEYITPPDYTDEFLSHSSAPAGGLALSLNGLTEFAQFFMKNISDFEDMTTPGNIFPRGTLSLFNKLYVTPPGSW
ncbi:hypothetical protein GEMRC1_003833 [Eukaryota sp. GEM-RC1]